MTTGRRRRNRRRGITLVETSLVVMITLTVLVAAKDAGLGVLHWQQLSWLAREGAQWASVHGAGYQRDNSALPPIKSDDILTKVVNPKLIAIPQGDVTCTFDPTTDPTKATVILSYTWKPDIYAWLPDTVCPSFQFTCKSVMPVTY